MGRYNRYFKQWIMKEIAGLQLAHYIQFVLGSKILSNMPY